VLDALNQCPNGLVAQPLFNTIENLEKDIKNIEKELRILAKGNRMVELLLTIPGCGEICAWTIAAYIDDIKRFSSPKKLASFAGLAPWVQNSNESIKHGRITKRGPEPLRTALVQVVMGLRRMKEKTFTWRLMQRYEIMKKKMISGKVIIATARKIAMIIWHMLSEDVEFDLTKMVDRKLAKKAESMRVAAGAGEFTQNDEEKKAFAKTKGKEAKSAKTEKEAKNKAEKNGGMKPEKEVESEQVKPEGNNLNRGEEKAPRQSSGKKARFDKYGNVTKNAEKAAKKKPDVVRKKIQKCG